MDLHRRGLRNQNANCKPQRFARRAGREAARGPQIGKQSKGGRAEGGPGFGRKRRRDEDDEIESDEVSGSEAPPSADSEPDTAGETADEARIRVARRYLKQFADAAKGRHSEGEADDAAEVSRHPNVLSVDTAFDSAEDARKSGGESDEIESDDDLFLDADAKAAAAEELKRKAEARKLLSRPTSSVAHSFRFGESTFLRGHKLPVTCVALPGVSKCDGSNSSNSSKLHAYTGGKDCCVVRWDLETGSKEVFQGKRNCFGNAPGSSADSGSGPGGHFRAVLDVCVAGDERIFFSAGADHTVRAWDPRSSTTRCIFELRSHRGPITGVRFNGTGSAGAEGDTELVTCSTDKSLKTWSLSCRSVVNHFYGHASEVNCMDLLQANKPITGGSDGTLRNWKLAQDTHTVFPPLGSCVDSVAMLSPSLFSCGTQAGMLALFNSSCKKPLACVRVSPQLQQALQSAGAARSVSALCGLPMTDALLVGTEGGATQIWSASQNDRRAGGGTLRAVPGACAEAGGVVTCLCVSSDYSFAIAAVSSESRLGRWYKSAGTKNGIRILPIVRE